MYTVLLRLLIVNVTRAPIRGSFYLVYEKALQMPFPIPGMEIHLTEKESELSLEVGDFETDRLIWEATAGRFVFERTYPFKEQPTAANLEACGFVLRTDQ